MTDSSSSRAAGALLLGRVMATISEAIIPLVIVRMLGKAEVGVLAGILVIYSTLALIFTAGFPDALMYFLPNRQPGERRAVVRKLALSLLGLGLLAGGLLFAVATLLAWPPGLFQPYLAGTTLADPAIPGCLFALAAYPLADLPARLLSNLLVVEQRARTAALISVFKAIGGAMALIIPLALHWALWKVILCIIIFGYLYGGIFIYYLISLYRGTSVSATVVTYRDLFTFSIPLAMTDMVAMLNNNFDRYLILSVFAAETFAEYNAGAWQVPMIVSIAYTVGTAYTPRFVELFAQGRAQEAILLWQQTVKKVSLVVVPIMMVFIVAAEETVTLLFTAKYLHGAPVFRIYSILTMGRVATFGILLVAAGQSRSIFKAALFSFGANIVLSLPLLMTLGFIGPALGTLVAFFPNIAIYCVYIGRAYNVPAKEIFPYRTYFKIVVLALLATLPALGLKIACHLPSALGLLLTGILVLGSFSALGTVTGQISRADWKYLGTWIRLKVLTEP